jgi:hypothetical protein
MRSPFLNLFLVSICLLAGGLTACDDIIEPDITAQHVLLITPPDSSRATAVVQTFRWETVANARTYRIQLASPSFANPAKVFRDSTVRQEYFTTSLVPGTYQWRVKGLNGSYETSFSPTRTLFLDTTSSLTGQTLQVGQPAAGAVTNATTINFSWTPLPMAQRYQLHISPNPRLSGPAALDTLVGSATAVSIRLPRNSRVYEWRVKALNAKTSVESASRTFEIDVTPPQAPALVNPAASASFLALPVTLTWTRSATDAVQDSIFLYQANQITLMSGFPRLSSGMSLTLSATVFPLTSGTYYWATRSMDRAGNVGPQSVKRAFILQ